MSDELVNCGSCSACCRRELVALVDGDNLADYPDARQLASLDASIGLKQVLPTATGWVIPHGNDGACIYLKEDKCSIYEKRPKMCRVFSCVKWVQRIKETTTRAERRRDRAFIDTDVWRAGQSRLRA